MFHVPDTHLPFLTLEQPSFLPLIIKIRCSIQFCNLVFCLSFQYHGSSKLLGCSLTSRSVEALLSLLVKSLFAWVLKTVKPAELELQPRGEREGGKCKLVIRCDDREKMCTCPLLPGPCVLATGERMSCIIHIIHWLQASCGTLL